MNRTRHPKGHLMGYPMALAGAVVATLIAPAAVQAQTLRGQVSIDGSSTVYPITEAVAEEFRGEHPEVRVTVGISGTGGGFKRFTVGEIDISDASRPIKMDEYARARENGIDFIEMPVAYDGLTVVVHPRNDFVETLTIEQLERIFSSSNPAQTWADVDPRWPDRQINVYSPGTDSGTFDYFKEAVLGKMGEMRSDVQVSEDDNVLVRGIAGDRDAIGYFGSAYYFENKDKVRSVGIVNDAGKPVLPSIETVKSGEYNPLSRPLFIYINRRSAQRPDVRAFVHFYNENAAELAQEVGYIPLPDSVYEAAYRHFRRLKTGTAFIRDGEHINPPVTEIWK